MPTTTISGTTDVEDTYILSALGTYNYGITTSLSTGAVSNPIARALIRVASSAIPAGSITGFRAHLYCYNNSANIIAHAVKAANDWAEGTKNSSTAGTGEVCWSYCKYTGQNWAGSVGCGTADTDYYTGGDDPTDSATASAWSTLACPTAWATNWRDTLWTNNGFVVKGNTGSAGNASFYSSEYTTDSTKTPYFEVDYTSVPVFVNYYRQRRT